MNHIDKIYDIYETFVHLSYFLNLDASDLSDCMKENKYKKVTIELRLLITDYLKKVN